MVQHRPADSALSRGMDGEDAIWGLSEHLLAVVADRLGMALWQNGGGKGRKPPLIPRPGTKPTKSDVSARRFDVMTIEDFERRMAERRAKQKGG